MIKYPKNIFVQRDQNASKNEEEPYIAWTNAESLEDGEVGIYELKKIVKKSTKVTIEG